MGFDGVAIALPSVVVVLDAGVVIVEGITVDESPAAG
jgi:hypothetical protein